MNVFKNVFHYMPYISIFILICTLIWFFSFYLPGVGNGSDAAGAGMASGFAMLGFYAFLLVYILTMIMAFTLFFKNTNVPVLRAILNCILLLPTVFGLGALGVNIIDYFYDKNLHAGSYRTWHASAKTLTYIHPSKHYQFQYSSHLKGTFSVNYIEPIELIESNLNTILFNFSQSGSTKDKYFIGSLSLISLTSEAKDVPQVLSDYFKEVTGHQCKFSSKIDHPFDLLKNKDIQVYTFEANEQYDNCLYLYKEHKEKTDKNFIGLSRSNRNDTFFIYDKKFATELLEIAIDHSSIITGPVEKNKSEKEIFNWYQALDEVAL